MQKVSHSTRVSSQTNSRSRVTKSEEIRLKYSRNIRMPGIESERSFLLCVWEKARKLHTTGKSSASSRWKKSGKEKRNVKTFNPRQTRFTSLAHTDFLRSFEGWKNSQGWISSSSRYFRSFALALLVCASYFYFPFYACWIFMNPKWIHPSPTRLP